MRVPIDWLRDFVRFNLDTDKLAERLTMIGLEVEEILRLPDGEVFSIYVTPNRGDCLSIYGIAREVYAMLGKECETTPLFEEVRRGFGTLDTAAEPGEAAQYAHVEILDPDLCPRYAARIVSGLKIGSSPMPIQCRLHAAGMRPISNIVDATNYVMLELGQPLHAFDLATLKENRIVVRQAREGETIRTLDGEQHDVSPPMLMICDAERPVAIAGVMGGLETEVALSTKTILLESAHFNPLSVRRTSKTLDLRTEASYRFERYVDPNLVVTALHRVCTLIEQMTGVAPVPGVLDVYPRPPVKRDLLVRLERAESRLGYSFPDEEARDALERLQLQPEHGRPVRTSRFHSLERLQPQPKPADSRVYQVQVPTFRPDLEREDDLIEEIGRVLGYERIPEALPAGTTTQGRDSELSRFANRVRWSLLSRGLQEVVHHTLGAPSPLNPPHVEPVRVRNVMSEELTLLRPSLLAGLLAAADRNRRYGTPDVQIFEIGKIYGREEGKRKSREDNPQSQNAQRPTPNTPYRESLSLGILLMGSSMPPHWQRKPQEADFYALKGMIEHLLASLGIQYTFTPSTDERLHPGRSARITTTPGILTGPHPHLTLGVMGEIHPELLTQWDFKRRVYVAELDLEQMRSDAAREMRYQPLPRFPAVLRDIALLVKQNVPYAQIEATVQESAGDWLESCRLFDRYIGTHVPEGWHSLAISLAFRHPHRSLTDEEINESIEAIFKASEERFGAKRRG